MSSTPLRCAGALIVDDQHRIFVQRRSPRRRLFPNCWDVVGGHVEPGETVEEALRREVWEETGWTVAEVLGTVGEYAYRGDDGLVRVETDFLVRVSGDLGAPRLEPGEHTEYRWLTPDELDLLDEYRPAAGDWLLRQIVADGFAALDRPSVGPAMFAGLLAPAIDRAFLDGMAAGRRHGGPELAARYGPGAGGWLVEFRTALATPGRAITPEGLAAVTRYRDQDECRRAVAAQAAAGWLNLDPDGGFRASERGLAYLSDLWRVQGDALAALWTDEGRVARLNQCVGRVLTEACQAGGAALQAMAPPHEPPDAVPAVVLLNRLGTLRYHRSDAHAAAWTAAGLTAGKIQALPDGAEREAIEADTNARAAAAYAVLSADERVTLLADLAALPGQRRD